jgi:hypothetical protein
MIPIFGMDQIELSREADWSENVSSIATQSALYYRGTRMMEFPFRFTLAAGVTVKDTATLRQHMITLHQLVAPTQGTEQGVLGPPKPGRLILSNSVNTKGILLTGSAIGQKPFTLEGGVMVPIVATFSGVFRMLPSYDGKLVDVVADSNWITSEAIASKFYQVGG